METLAEALWGQVGLGAGLFWGLVAASVVTSAMTAALGMGGGLVMLALLANVLPAAAVIPVHGLVQLGSSASRSAVYRRHVAWRLLALFAAGALAGTLIGAAVVVRLPAPVLTAALGLFLLISVRRPRLGGSPRSPWLLAPFGALASFLTMFVGATGPFVAACLAPLGLPRHRLIGTHAVMMLLQHGLKVVAFGVLGFAFGAWLPLVATMIAAGFLGTLLGRLLLDRLPERAFGLLFRALLIVLALRLLYESARAVAG